MCLVKYRNAYFSFKKLLQALLQPTHIGIFTACKGFYCEQTFHAIYRFCSKCTWYLQMLCFYAGIVQTRGANCSQYCDNLRFIVAHTKFTKIPKCYLSEQTNTMHWMAIYSLIQQRFILQSLRCLRVNMNNAQIPFTTFIWMLQTSCKCIRINMNKLGKYIWKLNQGQ